MPDPNVNPDGTRQVSPPTRSAFAAPEAPAKKAAPTSSQDASDKTGADGGKSDDHEGKIIDGLKGLIRQHSGEMFNQHEEDMDSAKDAVDKAVASTPGNSADY